MGLDALDELVGRESAPPATFPDVVALALGSFDHPEAPERLLPDRCEFAAEIGEVGRVGLVRPFGPDGTASRAAAPASVTVTLSRAFATSRRRQPQLRTFPRLSLVAGAS